MFVRLCHNTLYIDRNTVKYWNILDFKLKANGITDFTKTYREE